MLPCFHKFYEQHEAISTSQYTLNVLVLSILTAYVVCLRKNQKAECSKNNLRRTLSTILLKSVSLFINSSLLYP